MVTLLEEIYCSDDLRMPLENKFKLGELMQKHGQVPVSNNLFSGLSSDIAQSDMPSNISTHMNSN